MGAALKAPKAHTPQECQRLEQLPNIGPAMAGDLRRMGIHQPAQLRGRDALGLYQELCRLTGKRQDPCVLDTFIAVTAFMQGDPPAPWWHYTPQRKLMYGKLHGAV